MDEKGESKMINAKITYKDGTEEPMEFRTFRDYGRYIDENAAKIKQAWAKDIRPTEIRQGKSK